MKTLLAEDDVDAAKVLSIFLRKNFKVDLFVANTMEKAEELLMADNEIGLIIFSRTINSERADEFDGWLENYKKSLKRVRLEAVTKVEFTEMTEMVECAREQNHGGQAELIRKWTGIKATMEIGNKRFLGGYPSLYKSVSEELEQC